MSAGAKRIRRFVADGLVADPAIEASVFAARHRPMQERELPAVFVFTDEERVKSSRALGPGVRRYERELELEIAVQASTDGLNDRGEGVADRLDDLAEAVEAWMFDRENEPAQDGFADAPWVSAILSGAEGGVAKESRQPSPVRVLTFTVLYHDSAPKARPSTLEDLTSIHIDHDLVPTDGQPDASDTIPVPTP